MKKILVFVSTLNGKITRGEDPEVKTWTSKSDQEYYRKVWDDSRLIVMGRKTWNSSHIKPSSKRLIIVMTHNPSLYKQHMIPGQIEFHDKSPSELVSIFNSRFDQMTVVGGPQIATSFLKEGMIDELWLTIEPRIFGNGGNLVLDDELDISLSLINYDIANDKGTLITKYSLDKSIVG